MISIGPLQSATARELADINSLLQQLRSDPASHKPVPAEVLREVLNSNGTLVLVVRDGERIIGTGTVIWNRILTDKFAFIEDVVVDSAYRGQGLGEKLTLALIDSVRAKKVQTIGLTSRPSRAAANKLYQKLGFQLKVTNYYELDL